MNNIQCDVEQCEYNDKGGCIKPNVRISQAGLDFDEPPTCNSIKIRKLS